ncbi:polymer-forming cytoskeletal protein [Pseudoxanthomonas sp.]|uniref:bactofilin family protein n=1 Tax=Pseudoxanthomonas sp. TaxID=1871049 RepID=UPI0028C4671E|nr:polymer-forming cytoskeletal protein [Pseudoxanthomonas sp.]
MFKNKPIRPDAGAIDTLIGPQVTIRGDVVFSGGLYVEGHIQGKVIAEAGGRAVLTVAEQGSIEGEVQVPVVVINGRMTGDVHALERIELATKARVQGNLHYKVVEMSAGAQLTGRLVHADALPAAHDAHEVAAQADAWATADA